MKFRFNRFVFQNEFTGGDGGSVGGGEIVAPTADTAAPAADTGAPAVATIEGGMAAMFGKSEPVEQLPGETAEAAAARARDEKGRFAQKPPTDPNAPPVDPLKKPAADAVKDLTTMPEGLTPKAQERFQALANENKEFKGKFEQLTQLAGGNIDAVVPMLQSAQAIQAEFREHGVSREQFGQATQAIGLLNRGDIAGFQALLEDQLRQVALVTGKSPGAIDALSGFPDLRQRVDSLQISEADAIELARNRSQQNHQQQSQRAQQQEQQREQQIQQQHNEGTKAVDVWSQGKMRTDLDFARIEPILLKQIQGGLLENTPPRGWPALLEKTYNLIKETSVSSRGTSTGGGGVLRPSGGEAVKGAPKDGFEAMWGKSATA